MNTLSRVVLPVALVVGGTALLVYAVARDASPRLDRMPATATAAAFVQGGPERPALEYVESPEPELPPVSIACDGSERFC